MPRRHRDDHRIRQQLAQECARIMTEEGVSSFAAAKRKAALRLAVTDRGALPDNTEIEQALFDYQRLFHGERQMSHLRELRSAALQAMRFLECFRPRLVGPVLSGTAGPHSDISLHLFADTPTDVVLFLVERRIPFDSLERRVTFNSGEQLQVPVLCFIAGDVGVEITIFAPLAEREAPRDPVDGRPMRRARIAEVEALLATPAP